jgi:hypothetical protein
MTLLEATKLKLLTNPTAKLKMYVLERKAKRTLDVFSKNQLVADGILSTNEQIIELFHLLHKEKKLWQKTTY